MKGDFADKLSRLKMLSEANFPSDPPKEGQTPAIMEEIEAVLKIRPEQSRPENVGKFTGKGEFRKLLKIIEHRIIELDSTVGNDKVNVGVFSDYFFLCPNAYALTYQLGKHEFAIALGTPLLAALYSSWETFNSWIEVGAFIDSILVHELAHCYGSMKHDKPFKDTMKAFCKKLKFKPIV